MIGYLSIISTLLCMKAMKYILFFVLLVPFTSLGQENNQFYSELSKAMQSGNTVLLSQLFHDQIDISSNGKEGSYNREQAQAMLYQFFQDNRPLNFNLKHKGTSADGQVYMIGQLETKGGQQFKIICRAKSHSTGYKVFKLDMVGSY